ncbi:MAG: hypothetical protein DMG06_19470 [Acidobacteria bacterium]|nr:MAG: hypothetical protein DMG06_19470 [Acidobacteriota bacterium]
MPVHEEYGEPHYDWPPNRVGKHAAGIEFGVRRHRQVDARTGNKLAGGLRATLVQTNFSVAEASNRLD